MGGCILGTPPRVYTTLYTIPRYTHPRHHHTDTGTTVTVTGYTVVGPRTETEHWAPRVLALSGQEGPAK